jgi:hypothetical protein
MLFAQAGGGGGGPEQLILLGFVAVAVVIGLVIQIFFLLTLSTALSRCSPRNRTMEPSMVWLNLIPCVGTVWIFFTVVKLDESLRREFRDRNHFNQGDFGQSMGITYNVLLLTGAFIPLVGPLLSLGGLVCFILYWVKIAGFSSRLAGSRSRGRYSPDEDDYDRDDRPYRRDDDDYDRDDRPSRRQEPRERFRRQDERFRDERDDY